MPKTYKNGQRELRAYEIMNSGRAHKGSRVGKRISCGKLTRNMAYDLTTAIKDIGGKEVRVYFVHIIEQRASPVLIDHYTSTDLTKAIDYITNLKRTYPNY